MLALRQASKGRHSAQCLAKRSFGGLLPAHTGRNYPMDYREEGFPVMDWWDPDYDPLKDPFNPRSELWTMNGPIVKESDMDDPKRLLAICSIEPQGKTATEKPVFEVISRTIREYHRAPPEDTPIRMSSRFDDDLGLDSLDVNELSLYWEHEFCQWNGGYGETPIRDFDPQKWETIGDVVKHICADPRTMVNIHTAEDWEFYFWNYMDHDWDPDYSHFNETVNDDGSLGEKCLNPSGIPEFAPRRDGKSVSRLMPPDDGVISDRIDNKADAGWAYGPAGLGGCMVPQWHCEVY